MVALVARWGEHPAEENKKRVATYRSTYGMDSYQTEESDRFIHFLQTFTRDKLKHDPQLISLIDVPLHMEQGKNQQNLHVEGARSMKIVYEEKVVLPALRVERVMADRSSCRCK